MTNHANILPCTAPATLTIIISNVCNQRCRFCGFNHDKVHPRFLALETVRNMHWLRSVKRICIAGSGEALTHPQYCNIIETFRKMSPDASIMLYTNGLALHGRKLDATLHNCNEIHISQNAVDQRTYTNIMHRGNLDRSMQNLKELAKKKPSHLYVRLSLVLLRETISSIPKFINLAKKYNFNEIELKPGRVPLRRYKYEMPSSSYSLDINKSIYVDMKRYADMSRIKLSYPHSIEREREREREREHML